MINPTSSQQGTPISATRDLSQNKGTAQPFQAAGDQLSTAGTELLKAKLASEPEVRPEMVERGRQLAADPSYPSAAILTSVASKILNSPDLSEDPS